MVTSWVLAYLAIGPPVVGCCCVFAYLYDKAMRRLGGVWSEASLDFSWPEWPMEIAITVALWPVLLVALPLAVVASLLLATMTDRTYV